MRKAQIDEQNRYMIARQQTFRVAADLVTATWSHFPEVAAVALTGSVARPLWKEVPRFSPFRRQRIEIWHECGDLDLVIWLDSLDRLGELRRARDRALLKMTGTTGGVANHQVDTFLFEPGTNRHLGRLCAFAQCPKENRDCLTPGCGAIPFCKVVDGFVQQDALLESGKLLYSRDRGTVLRAVDLPATCDDALA